MVNFYLSKIEIKVLVILVEGPRTVGQLSGSIGLDKSTISSYVSHLDEIGLVSSKRKHSSKYISLPDSIVGSGLRSMITEHENLDPVEIFRGHGLFILTRLVNDGLTMAEMIRSLGLSRYTLFKYLKRWMGMGILQKDGHGGRYSLNLHYPHLRNFLEIYSREALLMIVKEMDSDAQVLFNDGSELLIASDQPIDNDDLIPAAYSHLARSGFDVVVDRDYYSYQSGYEGITDLRAIIQSIAIDSLNPRPRRLLKSYLHDNHVEQEDLVRLMKRYGVEEIVEKEVNGFVGEETIQEK